MKFKKGDIVKILNTRGTSEVFKDGIPSMNEMIGNEYEVKEIRHNENKCVDGVFPYEVGGWGWLEENLELVKECK